MANSNHNKFPLNFSNLVFWRMVFYFNAKNNSLILREDFKKWCDEKNIKIYVHKGEVYWNGTEQDRIELLLTCDYIYDIYD